MSLTIGGGLALFQFHKGAIKTLAIGSAAAGLIKFQFHKGAIKTSGWWLIVITTMVSIP